MTTDQPDLFDSIYRSADFSLCRKWRYTLIREWNDNLPRVVFILLNPSTANELKDDPTNRRGIDFARRWAYGSVVFVNLFAVRSPNPQIIKEVSDPIGPENDEYILKECKRADLIICAWGTKGFQFGRDRAVLSIIPRPIYSLGLTKENYPQHPLYLKNKTKPEIWKE